MTEWHRDRKLRAAILWTLWFLYVVAWTTALLTPHPVRVAEAVLPPQSRFLMAKTLHVAAYLVLTVLTLCLSTSRSLRWAMLAFLSAHAMGTEYFQQFVPTRTGSWRDVGLDHIGILLGLALYGIAYIGILLGFALYGIACKGRRTAQDNHSAKLLLHKERARSASNGEPG